MEGSGGNVLYDPPPASSSAPALLQVVSCAFLGGMAQEHGGNLHVNRADQVIILHTRVEGGQSQDHGGGISIRNTRQVWIEGSYLDSNQAVDQGGGLRIYASNDEENQGFYNVTLVDNWFGSNAAGRKQTFDALRPV